MRKIEIGYAWVQWRSRSRLRWWRAYPWNPMTGMWISLLLRNACWTAALGHSESLHSRDIANPDPMNYCELVTLC